MWVLFACGLFVFVCFFKRKKERLFSVTEEQETWPDIRKILSFSFSVFTFSVSSKHSQ